MSARPNPASVLRTLSQLAETIAENENSDAIFAATADAANAAIGHALFTVMAFDAEIMEVKRVYSSTWRPQAVSRFFFTPPGGQAWRLLE